MTKVASKLTTIAIICCANFAYAGAMGEVNPVKNWTGFYLGLNGGYSWSDANTQVTPLPVPAALPIDFLNTVPVRLPVSASGGTVGAQLGYNFQLQSFLQWVVGIETDINWNGLSGSGVGNAVGNAAWDNTVFNNVLSTNQKSTWFGTLRPRLGFLATPTILLFGTGGLAYGNLSGSANTDFVTGGFGIDTYPGTSNVTKVGWTAGGGVEWAPAQQWSVKLEYLYYDLGTASVIANPSAPNPPYQTQYVWTNAPQVVRLGINFHFK